MLRRIARLRLGRLNFLLELSGVPFVERGVVGGGTLQNERHQFKMSFSGRTERFLSCHLCDDQIIDFEVMYYIHCTSLIR